MIITTILELLAVLLLIWAFWHEDKFITFENKVFEAIIHKFTSTK